QEGIIPSALTLENISPGLLKVVERAKREPEGRFHALAHLLDVPALTRAYRRARSDAAVGVDGVTKEQYGQELEPNFQALPARWILEADIVSFFDSLDRTELKKMLEVRVAAGSLLRLIGKCLHVGVLDGEEMVEPELGTAQGSVLSPLLGNVYLHYVLDLWFETEVKPRLQGKATLIRYCDDFIIGFEREDDARRVQAVLDKRMGRYGLTLHPDKTRLVPFWCPPQVQQRGQGPATFDFLGFTLYWRRT